MINVISTVSRCDSLGLRTALMTIENLEEIGWSDFGSTSPTLAEKTLFFEKFIQKNSAQIRKKSRILKVEIEEIQSTLCIIIFEKLEKYDYSQGAEEAYFFAHLHARFHAYAIDVCSHALTIDDDSEEGAALRRRVEYWSATQQYETCFTKTNGVRIAAGAANLLALADAASGKSSVQIANELKISPRRVNQILKEKREIARAQCAFDFDSAVNIF